MIAEAWQRAILRSAERFAAGDEIPVRLLASLLEQQDSAKAQLAEHFGCTGMPWPTLVEATIQAYADAVAPELVTES